MPIQAGKKRLFSLVTAILSVSAVLVGGELMVRLFLPIWEVNSPDWVRRHSLQYIGSIFSRYRLTPAQTVEEDGSNPTTNPNSQRQNRGILSMRRGYRGPNFSPRKPNGVKRIVIIGGSAVFDQNMKDSSADEGHDWPHSVERILRKKGFKNVEVINAGIPGHASFDALGRLYSELWICEPDYVLFYEAWNDIKYFRDLTPEKPLISLYHTFYGASNVFAEYQGWWDRFLSNSQLYVKLRNRYYEWKARDWKIRLGREGVAPEGNYQDTLSPYALRQYKLNVELIVDASRNIGATPILLTQATLVSPANSEQERTLISYQYQLLTHSALVRAFDETYQIIRSVGQEKRAPVLNLAKELNGKREFFTDHVHLSAKGSEEVARRVADFLIPYLEARATNHPQISAQRRGEEGIAVNSVSLW